MRRDPTLRTRIEEAPIDPAQVKLSLACVRDFADEAEARIDNGDSTGADRWLALAWLAVSRASFATGHGAAAGTAGAIYHPGARVHLWVRDGVLYSAPTLSDPWEPVPASGDFADALLRHAQGIFGRHVTFADGGAT